MNVGNIPTFRNTVREEVLDITLCTRELTDKVKHWRVADEPSLSDHEQILYDLTIGEIAEPEWRINLKNTN